MSKQLPLVVVLGATACGKSKLAIELAQRFRGEIISADSMQVYNGLDIVTNKVTEEEQKQVQHHMINIIDPLQRFSVVDFKHQSLNVIEQLLNRDSLPIVVGGTNYYIESLLWKDFIVGPTTKSSKRLHEEEGRKNETEDGTINSSTTRTLIDSEAELLNNLNYDQFHAEEDLLEADKFFKKPIYNEAFKSVESKKLWSILEQVDPETAHIYHPNDKRRIIRCLQVIQEKHKNYSELLRNKNISSEEGKSSLGGPLRFDKTCILWLNCDNAILEKVLDERVDQMFDQGLLTELDKFHEQYNRERMKNLDQKPDYQKGIFQTIGFKEFHDYLKLEPEARETADGQRILRRSIEEMKVSTRQYAKRQLKWIRRRLLQAEGKRDLPLVYKLNVSFSDEEWTKQVKEPAIEIVDNLINGTTLSDKLLELKQEAEEQIVINNPGKFHCEICDRTFIGTHYIEEHLNSRRHKKNSSKFKEKRQRLENT